MNIAKVEVSIDNAMSPNKTIFDLPEKPWETWPADQKDNQLNDIGYKIFLDRYAYKDMRKETLKVEDTVVAQVDAATGQREIGEITTLNNSEVTVKLRDGETLTRKIEHIDKPLELKPSEMMDRVAKGIAATEAPDKRGLWQKRFRWLLDGFKFVPAGRILTAAGTDQQLTYYNCYVIPSPKDSRGGIMETLAQMTEVMSRGGGVGINLSSLRPRYSYVKGVNGRSSGAVSWGALYSFVTGLIEQGGSRRGALMLILDDWHPDMMDFIVSKRQMGKITNANISVGISDKFIQAARAGQDWDLVFPDTSYPGYNETWDGNLQKWRQEGKPVKVYKTVKAKEIWDTIIESAWASAEPGVFFNERYNKMSNSWYFAPIACTNPCVTGDTLIYSSQGLVNASELYKQNKEVKVTLDGRFEHVPTTAYASNVFITGKKMVYRLQTKEGYYLRATADHRIMTASGWKKLESINPGESIHILNRKGAFGIAGSLKVGRTLGWLVGDGTLKNDEAVLSFFGEEKRELAPMFANYVNGIASNYTKTNSQYHLKLTNIPQRRETRIGSTRLHTFAKENGLTELKHQVPNNVLTGSEDMQRGFLQALFTADGTVGDGGVKGASVRLAANNLKLLEDVQRVLLNFGIASRIYQNRRRAGLRYLPDSQRQLRPYWCKAQHELSISKQNLVTFAQEIGFLLSYKQEKLERYLKNLSRGTYQENFTARVETVTPDGVETVYDLTEPLTHSFIGNGIVVHNCGEQGLPAWGVCNLGAVNLTRFIKGDRVGEGKVEWEKLGSAIHFAVRFLDDVIDATPYFYDENERQQKGERRVGLNTMGLAELLIRMGIRYGSDESVKFIDKLYEFISREVYTASAEIATEKGAFPKFDADKFLQSGYMQTLPEDIKKLVREKGARNVTLLTQAPNGTIGTMVGTSTGIEPFYDWTYFRKSRLGIYEENVSVLREWQQQNPGAQRPDYFVSAMDLEPESHVKVEAAIQRWVDASISKTCNLPNQYTVEDTRKIYELMYDLGVKSGTVYRDGSRDEQVLTTDGEKAKEGLSQVAKWVGHDETPQNAENAQIAQNAVSSSAAIERLEQVPPRRDGRAVTALKIRPRAAKLTGSTIQKKTPAGTAFITMNDDEHGQPFEVFIDIGKGGSDLKAMAEALGRLISLVLRVSSPITPVERVREVIDQLQGISGSQIFGFGKNRVSSLPDGVAQVLEENYGVTRQGENDYVQQTIDTTSVSQNTKPATLRDLRVGELCKQCGNYSLTRMEGCKTCQMCGYSECG